MWLMAEVLKTPLACVQDSYFYVVVFHGTTIAQWRKAGYHEQEEHAAFKLLLEVGPVWLPVKSLLPLQFETEQQL